MRYDWPGPEGSLRDLVKGGLSTIHDAIEHLCVIVAEIDTKDDPQIKIVELEMLGLQEAVEELEQRISALESHKNLAQMIAREVLLVVVVVVVVVWVMTR